MKQIIFNFKASYITWHVNVNDSTYKKLKEMGLLDSAGYMQKEDFLRMVGYAYNSSREAKKQ